MKSGTIKFSTEAEFDELKYMQLEQIKTLLLPVVFILLTFSCSSPLKKTEIEKPPFGDWYATNRHMNVKKSTRYLIDTVTYNSKDFIDKYYIHSVIQKPNNSYLLTLTYMGKQNAHVRRYFVMNHNFQSMREFSGDRVIHWSRSRSR